MADVYVGKVTEIKKEGSKLIVHGTLMKGKLHGHNAMLVFEDKPEVEELIENHQNYLVTFGRRSFSGDHFNGRIANDVDQPENKNDQVVIPIARSPLLEIIFLDNVMADDNFLVKFPKRRKIVSVQFFNKKKSHVHDNLKSALQEMQKDLSELMKSFLPVFGTGNIAERKRIIAGIKSDLKSKGMTLLGVGGNGIVLKVNLLGKDYALKIAKKLKKEIVNLRAAQGIIGVPKFCFKISVKVGFLSKLDGMLIEFSDGPVLEDYVKTNLLPDNFLDHIEAFAKQLHSIGMAHRDLNPDNIKVVGDYPVFMDFGLSSPKASAAEKRFDEIFVEGLKLQFLGNTVKYRSNRKALAVAIKQIVDNLMERSKTETSRENVETIQIILREAKKRGLLT